MLKKKEMISGFCLAPLTLYAGLKTKEHQIKVCKDQSDMKSLQKMYGWTLAGGLCNYTVYQNIEHLFQKMSKEKDAHRLNCPFGFSFTLCIFVK